MKKIIKLLHKAPYQLFAYMVLMSGVVSTVNTCKYIAGQPKIPDKLKERVKR